MTSTSEQNSGRCASISASGDNWKDRFASLPIDSVVVDERAFKIQLGIGEDTYLGNRLFDKFHKLSDIAGGAAIDGTIAGSSVVAGAFFSTGGILGLLGLGTAATPVGWVIAAAAVSGLGWAYSKRKLRSMSSGEVEVVPVFINTPIDVLALSLFELMAPLALKVAMADGEIHDEERNRIKEYFTRSWGYDPSFVELGIGFVEEDMSEFKTRDLSILLAEFANKNRDCNYTSMTNRIAEFLRELIEADGKIHEEEERALDEIRQNFNDRSLVSRVTKEGDGNYISI